MEQVIVNNEQAIATEVYNQLREKISTTCLASADSLRMLLNGLGFYHKSEFPEAKIEYFEDPGSGESVGVQLVIDNGRPYTGIGSDVVDTVDGSEQESNPSTQIRKPIVTIDDEDISDMFYQRLAILKANFEVNQLEATRDLIKKKGIFKPDFTVLDFYRLSSSSGGAALNLLNMVIGDLLEDADSVSTCEGYNEVNLLPGEANKKQPNKDISSHR